MEKIKALFLFLILLSATCYNKAYSQISEGGTPPSFAYKDLAKKQSEKQSFITPIHFNVEELKKEDEKESLDLKPLRLGVLIPVDLSIDNSGEWETLPSGEKIWKLSIKAPDALAISLYYDEFYIPKGDKLFIYSKDKRHVLGAYTYNTNPEGNRFATELIAGDEIILEYVSSAGFIDGKSKTASDILVRAANKQSDKPRIHINEINYGYNNINIQYSDNMNTSGSCEVNINCLEGENWQDQKRGVFKSVTKSRSNTYWSSGTLLNNTNEDLDPLILTACHCVTNRNIDQAIYYFNYEQPNCQNDANDILDVNTMVGATLLVESPINGGSDGALLRLKQRIPKSYNVYYNGWDVNGSPAKSGVGIHHPAGDTKKISTYTQPLTTDRWTTSESTSALDAHWRVEWAATENGFGTTEPGSSGSPLFNEEGLVIGTLTGGASKQGSHPCDLNKYALYGKLWYHWNQHTDPSKHMLPYLNPTGAPVKKLEGTYTDSKTIADFTANKTDVYVSETVTFHSESSFADTYEWSFPGGTPATATTKDVNVSYNAEGKYTVSLTINKGTPNEKTRTIDDYINVSLKKEVEYKTIIVGEGTSTSSFPLGTEQVNSYSSSIYTASELGNKPATITELSWYANTAVPKGRRMRVYMKEVDEDTHTPSSWNDEINGATRVYESHKIWSNWQGWNTINLDTPFSYSGTKNLKILVYTNTPDLTGATSANINYSSTPGKHMHWSESNKSGTVDGNRPNIKLKTKNDKLTETPEAKLSVTKLNINEEFENEFPTTGWEVSNFGSSSNEWFTRDLRDQSFYREEPNNIKSAIVLYDVYNTIDTWLKSPSVEINGQSRIEFYALYGDVFIGSELLQFYVSTDNGVTWNREWANEVKSNFGWTKISIDLSAYAGKTVRFAWRYYGIDADTAGIDDIKLYTSSADQTVEIFEGEYIYPLNFSTGTIAESKWTLPGGTPSESFEENPKIQYKKEGKYDIALNVKNPAGSDEAKLTEAIIVSAQKPIPSFETKGGYINQENKGAFIPIGGTVEFKETIQNYPLSHSWTFEGGNPATSTDNKVSVGYSTKGKYNVTLSSANSAGIEEITIPDFVQVGDKANIWNIPEGESGDMVHLDDYNSEYITGTNHQDIIAYAERFDAPSSPGEISEVKIMFKKDTDHPDDRVLISIYSASESKIPSVPLTSVYLAVSDIIDGDYTTIIFSKPAIVSSDFFVYVTAAEQSNVAIMTTSKYVKKNSAYLLHKTQGWYTMKEKHGFNLNMNIVPTFKYSELEVDKNNLQFNDKGNLPEQINVSSNSTWKATPSASWILLTDISNNSFKVNLDDNKQAYKKGYITVTSGGLRKVITVEQAIAAPLNLVAANEGDHNVNLNWKKDFPITEDIFDDFESYEPFTINPTGKNKWYYIDGDGLPTYTFHSIDFPNAESPMAYIIFNPQETTPPFTSADIDIKPHSGTNFLASFSSQQGTVNDWIVSPELNFEGEFRFSFWARSYSRNLLENFKVMYSTSHDSDFLELSDGILEAPAQWTRYEFTVPAGTKYVAINCISDNEFIFMVDDIFIGKGNTPARAILPQNNVKAEKSTNTNYKRQFKGKTEYSDTINKEIKLNTKAVSDNIKIGTEPLLTKLQNKTKIALPINPSTRLMKWHNGIPHTAITFGNTPHEVGIRFDAEDLSANLGYQLSAVDIYILNDGTYTLKIYINGEVVASQPITDLQIEEFVRIELIKPIDIDPSIDELIIACEVSDYIDLTFTVDDLPNIAGKGALIKKGRYWENMIMSSVYGNYGNWNMTGILNKTGKEEEILYNVYRQNEKIAETNEPFFTDENVPVSGNLCYTVTATQKNGADLESSKSNEACTHLKQLLTVKANDIERNYGADNPDVTGEYTIDGFIDGDTDAMLSKKPEVSIDPIAYPTSLQVGVYENAVEVMGAEDDTNKYRFKYKNGSLTINSLNNDASLKNININGIVYNDVPELFSLDCHNMVNEVNIEVAPNDPDATVELATTSPGTIVDKLITVNTEKPSRQEITFIIVANDGKTKEEFTITIERYFAFDDLVITRWGSTMTVINNPLNNGGYKFISYKWYRIRGNTKTEVSQDQSYYPGEEHINGDKYYVELTTDQNSVLRTCETAPTLRSLIVKAYPNPISGGESIYIDADIEDELLENAVIEVYNASGHKVKEVKVTGRITPVTLESSTGTYIFKFKGKEGFSKELKVIKK